MMDAEIAERIDKLEARIEALESVLGDIGEIEEDPWVSVMRQHRAFAAKVQARREAQ
jgi:hypothetical protein